jgi:predicted RNase H-like nuclease (RuvC/YqgF family)
MPVSHETPRDLRKKLTRATASHKALKNKLREKQYELKKLKSSLSAMEVSRDNWRLHSKENEVSINYLKQEICNITKERDDLKTQVSTIDFLEKKKTRLILKNGYQVTAIISGLSILPFCL